MRAIRVWACLVAAGILILVAGVALATRSVEAQIATPEYDGSDKVVTASVACGTVVDEARPDIPEGWTYTGPSCQDRLLQMSRTSLLYLPTCAALVIFAGLVARTHRLRRTGFPAGQPACTIGNARPLDNRPATSKLF